MKRFTLTELLIIIGILIVFSLLMLPMLNRYRHRGPTKISCINNLKQIGLAMRMYSTENNDAFPYKNGRPGLQMLAEEGYLENFYVYTCPATSDTIKKTSDISNNASFAYAGGLTEADCIDSGIASDRADNHSKYGNILFIDGHVKGYAGTMWSSSAQSILTDFK